MDARTFAQRKNDYVITWFRGFPTLLHILKALFFIVHNTDNSHTSKYDFIRCIIGLGEKCGTLAGPPLLKFWI